ncbi:NADH-cytochrome b5 reductase-like [Drosophila hydei]|uniref:NADH-cytochrome b5 reductase-like n=1 Tax=Drosophila hydei TaxID=7224 RepID=A0A6J1LER1_DROHY|nr:NADH-cytochrome b5 reductase-like [Drosophila hydei]
MPNNEVDETDCCGNGCTNCILDNKPKPSQQELLAGKRNVILNYAKFKMLSNEVHNGDAQLRLMHFVYVATENDENDCILDIPPGYHVMLRAELPGHAVPLLRPYSPYWTDLVAKEFKILVKLLPGGPMSDYLAALEPLQVLNFRGPIGNYVHDSSSPKCIYIIAQGVAIASTLPLVAQVLDNEDDMSCIFHAICAQDLHHVYFRDRILEFSRYWNYRSCIYLAHQLCSCGAANCDELCMHLKKKLRYNETACRLRLDVKQLAVHAAFSKESVSIVIIAGYATFQRVMRDQAISAFNLSDENIYLL